MNAIVGPNGSGKTTIIEALYTLLRGSSFKGTLSEIVQYSANQYSAEMAVKTEHSIHRRSLRYQQVDQTSQKRWKVDNKNYARLPFTARVPVVLFEPDLARLISGGPERRRNYIDLICSQLNIETASIQNRFDRALKQRNKLLKQLRDNNAYNASDELFIWNTQLAHLSEQIIIARLQIIEKLQNQISDYYRQLGGDDDIFLTYKSTVSSCSDTYASRLLQFLETSALRDIALGYTSFGPHRDDVEIRLSDQLATQRASRGEIRTVVIAMKLLETELLTQHFKNSSIKPVLLLDDVLSELDLVHQERVLAGFKTHQVFITTTDAHALTPGVHTIGLV